MLRGSCNDSYTRKPSRQEDRICARTLRALRRCTHANSCLPCSVCLAVVYIINIRNPDTLVITAPSCPARDASRKYQISHLPAAPRLATMRITTPDKQIKCTFFSCNKPGRATCSLLRILIGIEKWCHHQDQWKGTASAVKHQGRARSTPYSRKPECLELPIKPQQHKHQPTRFRENAPAGAAIQKAHPQGTR